MADAPRAEPEAGARLRWIAGLGRRNRMVLAAGSGLAAGAGQAPFDVLPVSLAGVALAFLLLVTARSGREAFTIGWLVGAAYFALTLHWIVEPFFVDAARHGWMAPFALLFVSVGFALFWGVAFRLACWSGRTPLALALGWSAWMALAEWLRGWVLTGFPWATFGYVWADTPVLQVAAWTGSVGLTLLTILCVSLLVLPFAAQRGAASAILSPLPIVGLVISGFALAGPAGPPAEGPLVRLVQPNAPQKEKWDPAHILTFYQRQIGFTAEPGAPDLIVWPETAIPWTLENAGKALSQIARAAKGVPVVLGLQRREAAAVYNSLVVVGPDGDPLATYDKHHLVPFGEYLPLASVLGRFGLKGLAADSLKGFSAGPGPQVLSTGAAGKALPLICYELIFPRNIRAAPERPDYLLHITNDAWFGQTAGPQQHLAQARVRAVEFGLPVVRAANTGISGMIDGQGNVLVSIPLGEAGYADARLPPALPPTLYARTGDYPSLIVAILLVCFAAAASRRFSH